MLLDKLYNFVSMGGYGAYIWASYGIALAVFAGLWLFAQRNKTRSLSLVAVVLQQDDIRS